MDTLAKLIQQAARKPGIGEVRICYFDTSPPTYHARAMPDPDTAMRLAVAEFEAKGAASVSLHELTDAMNVKRDRQLHHGQGRTHDDAVRALLVEMAKPKAG